MAGVRDVAEQAGVSIATVSRVLNGTAKVREPLRQRVLEVAEELGYTPSFAAQSLRTQRTRVIGLVLPSLSNPYFPLIIGNVNQIAQEFGYRVLISATDEFERDATTLIQSRMVDGLLVVAASQRARVGAAPDASVAEEHLLDWAIPAVAIDRAPLDPRVPLVTVDNSAGAILATEHLIGLGRRRIAHISGPLELSVSQTRLQGFQDALRAHDLEASAELVVEGDFGEESGYRCAWQLARLAGVPDAIFCANDMMAVGALRALREARLSVPRQVAVIGFDGLELARYVWPSLTTIAQPTGPIVRNGLEILTAQIDGEPTLDGRVVHLPGELVIRESTGLGHQEIS